VLGSALDRVLCHLNADRTLASCSCKNPLGVIFPSALRFAKWPPNQSYVTRKKKHRASKVILIHVTAVWVNEFVLACVFRADCTSRRVLSLSSTSEFIGQVIFRRFSQNCEKRLLASSCPFVCPQGTTRLPLDGFP
jgi:hypothetical protein